MEPGVYHLRISPRGSVRTLFAFAEPDATPVDFTGAEARVEVRNAPDGGTLYLSISETPSPDGYITVGATPGQIALFFTAESTDRLAGVRRAYWDLFVEFPNGEDVVKMMKGRVLIDPSVTDPTHD
jgi:hypothetical protein